MSESNTNPYCLGMLKAAAMLDVTNQDILLAAGEIGSQALRDVRAVLAWKKGQIEREAENFMEKQFANPEIKGCQSDE